jgi:hypothetical protein
VSCSATIAAINSPASQLHVQQTFAGARFIKPICRSRVVDHSTLKFCDLCLPEFLKGTNFDFSSANEMVDFRLMLCIVLLFNSSNFLCKIMHLNLKKNVEVKY